MGRGHGGTRAGGASSGASSRNIIDNPGAFSAKELLTMSETNPLAKGLATAELNRRVEIVKLANESGELVFKNPNGKIIATTGFGAKIEGLGYVGTTSGVMSYPRKLLKDVMENQGGFTGFTSKESVQFYNPVGIRDKGGRFVPNK